MFPLGEKGRHLVIAFAALIVAAQLVLFGMAGFHRLTTINIPPQQNEQISIAELKDNWELLIYEESDTPECKSDKTIQTIQNQESAYSDETAEMVSYLKEEIDQLYSPPQTTSLFCEKINLLAQQYNADPAYLDYIVKVEKIFNLQPCELLAIIAQESGFKPQTHMDGGSLSYSTTQMKIATAKTAHMAITEYYKMEVPYPSHELLNEDKYYAAFLAGGYLRYLHDTYQDKYESYTAYNWGIGGRMIFYNNNGHFKSPYAVKVASLSETFQEMVGTAYNNLSKCEERIDLYTTSSSA